MAQAMVEEAYWTLEAVRTGERWRLVGRERWVAALKACRWLVETEQGPTLTEEGFEACDDLAARYRSARAA